MTHRVGVYPGTFDPVHQGHLAFCLEVIRRGVVDEVVLLPERFPRNKPAVTTLSKRLELLQEAILQFPLVNIVSLASSRFTITQTLPELQGHFKNTKLSLLIGSDIVPSLGSWDGLPILLHEMPLVVGLRATDEIGAVEAALERIGQAYPSIRFCLIETAYANVSSSYIRSGKLAVDLHTLRLTPESP